MFLTMSANSHQPGVIPNPSVGIVASFAVSMRGILGVQVLPKNRVIMLTKTRKPFVAHRSDYLRGCITTFVDFFEKNAVDLLPLYGVGLHEFNSKVGGRSAIPDLRYECNAIREARIALLLCTQRVMKRIHHRFDVRRKVARFLQNGPLIRAEGHKLQCDWKPAL